MPQGITSDLGHFCWRLERHCNFICVYIPKFLTFLHLKMKRKRNKWSSLEYVFFQRLRLLLQVVYLIHSFELIFSEKKKWHREVEVHIIT
jgi:hypothetical protein